MSNCEILCACNGFEDKDSADQLERVQERVQNIFIILPIIFHFYMHRPPIQERIDDCF